MKLSVIILAKNEAELIGVCIDSVKSVADQILVIDDNSIDRTAQIAEQKGARVVRHEKKNFAEARNFAQNEALGEWLFYIDADEQATAELVDEIRQIITSIKPKNAYSIVRQNYYLGKKWPRQEKLVRLFQKNALEKWYGDVHESAQVKGEIGELHSLLNHYTHRNLSEMVENTIIWSEIEARLRHKAHHPQVVWWRIPRVMIPTFFDYYITQGGWRVGTVGLIESIYQAFSIFITYARLWEMQQTNSD